MRRSGERWEMPGIEVAAPEPELHFGKIIRAGANPVPRFAVKCWRLPDHRLAGVIGVRPIVGGPCITSNGAVYNRVSGETLPITDPVVLAGLFNRGKQAEARAEQLAREAPMKLLAHDAFSDDRVVRVGVGLAATAYDPGIGGRLFTREFEQELSALVERQLVIEASADFPEAVTSVTQSSVRAARGRHERQWLAAANWDGSAAVIVGLSEDGLVATSTFDFLVLPAWKVANHLVSRLGGYGSGRLTLVVLNWKRDTPQLLTNQDLPGPYAPSRDIGIFGRLPGLTVIGRQVELREPTSQDLGSMQREFQRAAGVKSWEGTTT